MSSVTPSQETSTEKTQPTAVKSSENIPDQKTEPTAVEGSENIPDQKTEGGKSEIESDTKKKPKKKKRELDNFSTYIFKVLKQVHPDLGISLKAMSIMNSFCFDMFERIAEECSTILSMNHRSILGAREVQTATRLVLPGDLAKHAVSEGGKAVARSNAEGNETKTRSQAAGLVFPVGHFHCLLREGPYSYHVQNRAPIFLAAVIEYLNVEIMELSGNAARDNKKITIYPRHIMLAVRYDEELNQLLSNVIIPSAGVVPHIHKLLLFEDQRKSRKLSQSPPKEE